MTRRARFGAFRRFSAFLLAGIFCLTPAPVFARSLKSPALSARSAIVMDARDGEVLYSKNPHLRLPPASTAKIMTVMIVLGKLPLDAKVPIGLTAVNVSPSKADLTLGAEYTVKDLVTAALVSSSNDAAVALAEAVSGTEADFAALMNEKARSLGMKDTHFVNATGLPEKNRAQYSTAYDLARLMRSAAKDPRIDEILGMQTASISGSDGRWIQLRNHNKMLWRAPEFVKGKTGWTFKSRHTFVGTNYSAAKTITFAMLSSKEPWTDIKRLANFGLLLEHRR